MYKSQLAIESKAKAILIRKLDKFLKNNQKVYCKSLKRTVFLDKLPDAILKRKQSATKRLQRFFVSIDILKNQKKYFIREYKGCLEYEIIGLDQNNKKVYIHLREELSIKKDRMLFFISCY